MNKSKKYCVLYTTRNYYALFENLIYKKSVANFDEVLVLNADINSTNTQKELGKEVCKKLGIHWINDDSDNYNSCGEGLKRADKWLTDNNIDVDWIISFEHDVLTLKESQWDDLDKFLEKYPTLVDRVGQFGGNTHQGYTDGRDLYTNVLDQVNSTDLIKRRKFRTTTGRGNLPIGIIQQPYRGWYQELPDEWYLQDYFVVETANHYMTGYNRKALKECVNIDSRFTCDFWPDDIGHQFMLNGFVNIMIPDMIVLQDKTYTTGTSTDLVTQDRSWLRGKDALEIWIEKYGWPWGKRNFERSHFISALNTKSMYKNTIQEQLFNMSIDAGPKKIEDFYEL